MQPGSYAITAEAEGLQEDRANQHRSDYQHQHPCRPFPAAGRVAETIMVTTAPPELQTDRADISTAIESTQISNLPHPVSSWWVDRVVVERDAVRF